MSAVTWVKFLWGSLEGSELARALERADQRGEFTRDHAETTARVFNESGRRGGVLVGCMIAAVALTEYASLATANLKDFLRFESCCLKIA